MDAGEDVERSEPNTRLMGMQTGAASMENSMEMAKLTQYCKV